MPGTYAKKVAATMNRDGRVELIHVGSDDAIYHAWQSSPGSAFGGWVRYPSIAREIAITSVGNGNWEMFHVGADQAIYRLAPILHGTA
jgi:hypothetical protein